MQAQAIKTEKYLDPIEIAELLKNVEYIIMAAPAPEKFSATPIHFSIFLNTTESFSHELQEAILGKFLFENKINNPAEIMSQLMPVGFGMSTQDTAMPMLLIKPEDRATIPHVTMFVMDFFSG